MLHTNYTSRGGVMVSALDSGSSGPYLSPGRGHCVVFLGMTLTPCFSLSRNINLMLGVTLQWNSILSKGSRNTPSRFMPGLKT